MKNKNLTILIVDDDMINLKLLESMLQKDPDIQTVLKANNGSHALEELKQHQNVDLVILDLLMPVMDGIEMLKEARIDYAVNELPIIILTTDDTRRQEALEVGASGFLRKPIRADELEYEISQVKNLL